MENTKLIECVKIGDVKGAMELIGSGANINQPGIEQEWTALNYAAGKGDLAMVKMLVENGADIAKVGKDQRTPYLIALAAGRVPVAKFLKETEVSLGIHIDCHHVERPYCKAYYLRDLRAFHGWVETRKSWEENRYDLEKHNSGSGEGNKRFEDDAIVFIHQDFSVTESMWHGENILFDENTVEWKTFCGTVLGFKVPDDFDLMVPDYEMEQAKIEMQEEEMNSDRSQGVEK
jgi:uncharacterized protein